MRRQRLPSVPICLILLVALLLGVGIARAPTSNTIHVDCTNTTGIEDGTEAHPFDTVQEGIDAAVDGDTVLVQPCTYYENIDFLGKAITVTSTAPLDPAVVAATVIDGGATGSVVRFAEGEDEDSVIQGFTVTNGNASYGAGVRCSRSSPRIAHCLITGNAARYGGGIACYGGSPVVVNNLIEDNRVENHGHGAGLYCTDTTAIISGNIIEGNHGDYLGGGLYVSGSALTLVNSVIVGNGAHVGAGLVITRSDVEMVNCTLADNRSRWGGPGISFVDSDVPVSLTIRNSIVQDEVLDHPDVTVAITYSNICTGGGDTWPGEGNICADPLLDGNYRLRPGSPCIDAGTNTGAPADDRDGEPRPWPAAGRVDIGADEWVGANLPPCCEITYLSPCPVVEEVIAFDSHADDGDGTVVSVAWDFGDGGTAQGEAATHAYTAVGDYLVTCTVTDDGGLVSTCRANVTVSEPVAIYVDDDCPCATPDGSPQCPYPSIQQAINAAQECDTVLVAPGVYLENIDFHGKAITVTSTDPLDPEVVAATVIDGGGAGSVVTLASGEGAGSVLTGMTVRNGSGTQALYGESGGGIYCVYASPVIAHNVITENSVEGAGGGVHCEQASSPVLRDNVISNNTADEGAGIKCMFDCNAVIEGNTITGNVAAPAWGGGISLWSYSSATIANNTIVGNSSANCGGGIDVYSDCSPLITGNLIADNIVTSQHFPGGAGIWCQRDCAPIITGNVITGNRLTYLLDNRGLGGGIATYRNDLDPIITDNVISDNVARDGGGIGCYFGSAIIARNTITGNSSAARGGGIYCESESQLPKTGSITDNIISNNHAATDGGAISLHDSWSTEIARNVITGNIADIRGGGIDCYEYSHPAIVRNIISGNFAGYGGAVGCQMYSAPLLASNLMCGNSAGRGGGIFLNDHCSPAITNCTIADNTATSSGDGITCFAGSWPTVCNSIIWNQIFALPPTSITVTYSDTLDCWPGEGNICLPPEFVDPANGDYHLLPTSPCIDMGTNECVAPDDVDIDGQPRIWPPGGIVDMGADESVPPPTCDISYTPSNPTTDDVITFDSGASDPYDMVISVDWDFGDGGAASGHSAAHQYAMPGAYQVTATVCNGAGLCTTCTAEVAVTDPCVCDVEIDRTHCKMPAAGHIGQCKTGQIGARNMSLTESCDVVLRVTDNAGNVVFDTTRTLGPGRRLRVRFDHCYTADEVGKNPWTWEVWPVECGERTPWNNVYLRKVNVQPGERASVGNWLAWWRLSRR